MRRAYCLILCSCAFWTAAAAAQDRLSVDGGIDLRWVHATSERSFLNGGLGDLRFDPGHEGVRLGRALLAANWRVTDLATVHADFDAYGDHDRNSVDVSEFYLDVRPFPTTSVRWRARVGAFFMPISLENRGTGWTAVYSITPSAVNTWLGEELAGREQRLPRRRRSGRGGVRLERPGRSIACATWICVDRPPIDAVRGSWSTAHQLLS
jgi:hypothetical protein